MTELPAMKKSLGISSFRATMSSPKLLGMASWSKDLAINLLRMSSWSKDLVHLGRFPEFKCDELQTHASVEYI